VGGGWGGGGRARAGGGGGGGGAGVGGGWGGGGGGKIGPRWIFGGCLFGEKVLVYLMWGVVGGPR